MGEAAPDATMNYGYAENPAMAHHVERIGLQKSHAHPG